MNKLQTSQQISKASDTITLKMPHVRKPIRLFNLYQITDSQIDILYEKINAGKYSREKQEILDILSLDWSAKKLFKEMLEAGNSVKGLANRSIAYMLELAEKEAVKPNATARDINSYRRLSIVDYILYVTLVWNVLDGAVIDNHGIDQELLSTE